MSNFLDPVRAALRDTFIWDLRENWREKDMIKRWLAAGKPVPPPEAVKRKTLAEYGFAFGLNTLIETGTFMGGALYALKNRFKTLYSIELSPELAANAKLRLKRWPQIHILNGDSAKLLPDLLAGISIPCLFWLDGHYSGGVTAQAEIDTPILKELQTVFAHPVDGHVILIDDARLFNGTHDYPTIDALRDYLKKERPAYGFSVVNDVIRMHPARQVKTTF